MALSAITKNDANAGMTKFEAWAYRGSRKQKGFLEKQGQLEQARKDHKFFGQEVKVSLHTRQSLPAQAGK